MTYTQPATADFLSESPTAYPLFYRTYSRRSVEGDRESWDEVTYRTVVKGLQAIGKLTQEETQLLLRVVGNGLGFPSGRWMWVGGTEWLEKPENFPGAFNCTSQPANGRPEDPWEAIASTMDLAMMGSGTGVVLEPQYVEKLPAIARYIDVLIIDSIFSRPKGERVQLSTLRHDAGNTYTLTVGDSRAGWVGGYKLLLDLASSSGFPDRVDLRVRLTHVRKKGERLEGFGGVANPIKLADMFKNVAAILNGAVGRQLTPLEVCLLIDQAAVCIVAGNLRRSAGMRQFGWDSPLHKTNLWQQDEAGNWRIDPARDALRMANHTRVYHTRPSRSECVEAVREQFYSGEGAIQFAPESIARASADILDTDPLREQFIEVYTTQGREAARQFLLDSGAEDTDVDHRLERYGLNPCVTGDTWVLTGEGPRQVRSLIGKQHVTFVDGKKFETTRAGFFLKGRKPIVRITTAEGYTLKLTPDHKVQKFVSATQRRDYGHWVEVSQLKPGDKILLHNHREIEPWKGWGSYVDGWETGRRLATDRVLVSRYGGPPLAVSSVDKSKSTFKRIPQDVEESSYEFHQGFLQSLFDEWCILKAPIRHGTALQIQHPYGQVLEQMQRMLLRLGIVCSVTEPQINPRGLRTPATLTISRDNLIQFKEVIGFSDPDKQNELELLLGNYQRHPDRERFTAKIQSIKPAGSEEVFDCQVPGPACFDANGFVAHNCGEIIGSTFACNLAEVHLNRIEPLDLSTQEDAFRAGALSVCALLQRGFTDPRFQWSRELDPIVAVCFTGGFDFFVQALGTDWLRWWQAGRPGRWGEEVFWEPLLETPHRHPGQLMRQSSFFRTREREYLEFWRGIVEDTVEDYCHRHGLKKPNRATAIQPSGSKSLLTGASPGWHPPKAQRFIRRMTFGKNDPVALACLDFGYSVVPSQSDKDESGRLLDDPFDPRCTEWLVEIPVEVPWANLPGASDIDISSFSALAQFDFYMQIQRHYVRHNTSATIELREDEVEPLGDRIYQAIQDDEGYISAALLPRFDAKQAFPRLPFEPIDKATYERLQSEGLQRRKSSDFHALLARYDKGAPERDSSESGPAGCDSDKCLMPQTEPEQK